MKSAKELRESLNKILLNYNSMRARLKWANVDIPSIKEEEEDFIAVIDTLEDIDKDRFRGLPYYDIVAAVKRLTDELDKNKYREEIALINKLLYCYRVDSYKANQYHSTAQCQRSELKELNRAYKRLKDEREAECNKCKEKAKLAGSAFKRLFKTKG